MKILISKINSIRRKMARARREDLKNSDRIKERKMNW
jgi:hypothetical protein